MYQLLLIALISIYFSFHGLNCDESQSPDVESQTPNIKCMDATSVPKPCGPYCSAVQINNTLYLSGMIGIDRKTKKLADGGIKHETEVVFKNVKSVLEEFGSAYEKVVSVKIYLDDINNMRPVNDLYATYFLHPYPARTLVGVSKLPLDAKIEVEVMALIDGPGRFIKDDDDMSFKSNYKEQ